jgi:hypothetical protein
MARTRTATTTGCQHEVLADSRNVSIACCSGGGIHLQMGPVTLSLTASEFAEVAAVVVCAIERLQRAQAQSAGRTH